MAEKNVSWANLTPEEATKELDVFVGGSGGISVKGLVPPADADKGEGDYVLGDDGEWHLIGAGTGDLLAANNLDDLDDIPTALENLGLDEVDNTSDADKPISDDTQDALDLKADSSDLSAKEDEANKDASGGYVGLTLFGINFKNALGTFTSLLQNANTAIRTYTFQNRNGTIADDTDITATVAIANAKVEDNLTASTSVAPSKTAVNTALALKAPLASPSFTGTVTSAGLLDLSGAAAGQIKFPATQNASADANTLDDYEEGTFSMGLAFAGVSTGITFSANTYHYTKIGDRLYFDGLSSLTNKGAATGSARLNNLPFTVNGSSAATIGYVQAITRAAQMMAYASGTTILLDDLAITGGQTNLTNTNFADNSQILISGHYKV